MINIITAMNNPELNEELKKENKEKLPITWESFLSSQSQK